MLEACMSKMCRIGGRLHHALPNRERHTGKNQTVYRSTEAGTDLCPMHFNRTQYNCTPQKFIRMS